MNTYEPIRNLVREGGRWSIDWLKCPYVKERSSREEGRWSKHWLKSVLKRREVIVGGRESTVSLKAVEKLSLVTGMVKM